MRTWARGRDLLPHGGRGKRKLSYGEKLYEKFAQANPQGTSKDCAEYASKNAWKQNSAPAHDEAAKAHDSVGNSDRAAEHEEAMGAIERGEKPEPKGGGAFDDDQHPRDADGKFVPK